MSRVSLLGVPIDALTRRQAVDRIRAMLKETGGKHVMTPNSEMLVEAVRHTEFRILLNRTALNLPDSMGLLWMAQVTNQHLPHRVTGVDTVTRLLEDLGSEHPVFLLGAAPGIADRAAAKLRERNPALTIAGTDAGASASYDAPRILEKINASKSHLLLVAFGAPTQDLWLNRHLDKLPSVRVAMGVGGTFDFLAGTVKRAPKIVRVLGLEWLWRLVLQPSRWRRIVRAVIVFPMLVIRYGKEAPHGK
jgi:N-acetylglucosaminyldiphosphoundecaprenol N-acetyl-beta-D-mannosaminyltransferase